MKPICHETRIFSFIIISALTLALTSNANAKGKKSAIQMRECILTHFGVLEESYLSWHSDAHVLPREIDAPTGFFVKSPKDVKNLPNGMYLYLLDDQGNLTISPVIPKYDHESISAQGGRFFASHRSTHKTLVQATGNPNPKIVAAGEFEISYGLVNNANNKAGTFRSGPKNLEIAKIQLPKTGLAITENTKWQDESLGLTSKNNQAAHQLALESAALDVMTFNHPRRKLLWDRGEVIKKKWYQLFPGTRHLRENLYDGPGKFDFAGYYAFDKLHYEELSSNVGGSVTDFYTALQKLNYMFSRYEGVPFAIVKSGGDKFKISEEAGLTEAERIFTILEKIIDEVEKIQKRQKPPTK